VSTNQGNFRDSEERGVELEELMEHTEECEGLEGRRGAKSDRGIG
jgi:hypothetical protein